VCFSIESRDGSGPFTSIYKPKEGSNSSDPIQESLTYFRFSELDSQSVTEEPNKDDRPETGSSSATPPDEWELRRAQIALRSAEIMEVVHLLEELEKEGADSIMKQSTRTLDGNPKPKNWMEGDENQVLKNFQNKLDTKNLFSLGHSFGSATMISLLRSFSISSSTPNPFKNALLLDPWLEPFYRSDSDEKFGSRPQAPLKTPLYVINSQGFTVWRNHFPIMKSYVKEAKENSGRGWFATLSGSAHTDFSDFPYTLPRLFKSKVPVEQAMSIFSEMTLAMIFGKETEENGSAATSNGGSGQDEEVELVKARLSKRDIEVRKEKEGEVKRKELGEPGVVIFHPLEAKL